MEEKDKNVIFDLGPEIRESLNISTLPQFLFKHRLATAPEERELLLNPLISPTEKKDKLLYLWLLQKGDDSLGRFVKALRESAQEEPTHEEIARKIEAKRAQSGLFSLIFTCSHKCSDSEMLHFRTKLSIATYDQ